MLLYLLRMRLESGLEALMLRPAKKKIKWDFALVLKKQPYGYWLKKIGSETLLVISCLGHIEFHDFWCADLC